MKNKELQLFIKELALKAQKMGYGVGVDPRESYLTNYREGHIKNQIQKIMMAHYHPLPILRQITTEIEARLRKSTPQYAGGKAGEGYEYATYKEWINIIKQFLTPKETDLCSIQGSGVKGFEPRDILFFWTL